MPRPTNFVAFIRNVVRDQVQEAVQGLLGAVGGPKKKAKNGRRRRRRRDGPGRLRREDVGRGSRLSIGLSPA